MKHNMISYYQSEYMEYIRNNPGCIIADVDRACRHNPYAGHKWVYDGVSRLRRRGFLREEIKGGKVHLFLSEKAEVL